MKRTITTLICALALSSAAAKQPNVIMIFTDDHGYADFSCQGVFDDVRTPNIDRLAEGGVRMTDGYCTAPQCVPSRGGLLSGQYQNKFGLESNNHKDANVMKQFAELETLPERLKTAGYATGMAGKWHLGPGEEIADHGFDHFYYRNSGRPATANIGLDGTDVPLGQYPSKVYHLDACSDVACSFIERHQNKPFFFYLAYRAPHVPLDATEKYLKRFPGEMPERRRKALAMLSAVDDGVGRIFQTLEKCGIAENTIIWVVGDNGAPLKIHKRDAPGGGPGWDGSLNDPMNGEKGMLSEGGIRVPFVVYWKGTIPGGQVYSHPVISLDMAATANALAGLPDAPELDGVNLMPYLTGENTGAPHEALCWRWESQSAIRKGQWKYLRCDDREYLFDMENDFEESRNLIQAHPEKAQQLLAELEGWAGTLQPPGIGALRSEKSSRSANRFFDWYLDGKGDASTPPADGKRKPPQQKEPVTDKKKGPSDVQLFEKRDRNKDGQVTLAEYVGGRTEKVEGIRAAFEQRDIDSNGIWEKKEIK